MKTNRFAAILRVLLEYGPMTPREIADRIGIPYKCLYGSVNYLAMMNDAEQIHVCDWERQDGHGGPPIPVYAPGPGRNVKRPRPLNKIKKIKQPAAPASVLGLLLGLSK